MKVKVGNVIFDGEKQPVMVILSEREKEQIANMGKANMGEAFHYCIYPDEPQWIDNDHEGIKRWMGICENSLS